MFRVQDSGSKVLGTSAKRCREGWITSNDPAGREGGEGGEGGRRGWG